MSALPQSGEGAQVASSGGDGAEREAGGGAGRHPAGTLRRVAVRALLHLACLVVAVGGFAAYAHFKIEGAATAALVSLVAAAGFGFVPLRDVLRVFFRVEGKALHVAHAVGGLGLVALPLTGVVSGAPLVNNAWRAPFAIMGAAQAVMHQNHPRNARQAAALQRFAASLPEVAVFANPKSLSNPANAQRAVAALSDVLAKAQALGETELNADPGFQSALAQVSTRFGASLGLDAVDLALTRLAADSATAGAVPGLRRQLTQARRTIAGGRR